jgi:hypothetical protein
MAGHANSYPKALSPEYLAEDSGQILVAISILFICSDTVFVALRFYARRMIRSSTGLDDFIIPFSWMTHVGLCVLGISKSIGMW